MKFVIVLFLVCSAFAQGPAIPSPVDVTEPAQVELGIPDSPGQSRTVEVAAAVLPPMTRQFVRLDPNQGARTQSHRFLDKQAKISLAVSTSLRWADATQTCLAFNHGAVEQVLPTQSCKGVVMWLGITQAGQMGMQYWFHKRHEATGKKFWLLLERATPWVFAAANAEGLRYSVTNTWTKLP